MTDYRAIIFDYDGTLVDLRATPSRMDALRAEIGACLRECEVDIELRPFYRGIDAALAHLSQRAPQAVTATWERIVSILNRFEEEFSTASDAKPFATQVIQAALHHSRVGIVSNNLALHIRPTLQRLNIISANAAFTVVGFEDTDQHKPDPRGLCQMAKSLGLTSGQCGVYVGDHCDDLEACSRFNALGGPQLLPFIVKRGKCSWDRIVSHPDFQPGMAINDLSELLALLSITKVRDCSAQFPGQPCTSP